MENRKYLDEVLSRIDAEIEKIRGASTPTEISSCERMLLPLLTEAQMVVPRIGDDIMKESQKRRKELLEGR